MPTPITLSDLNKTGFGIPQAQAKPVAPVAPVAQKQGFSTLQGTEIHSDIDDYVFQFFMGSVSVIGLFILFRIIQKSK